MTEMFKNPGEISYPDEINFITASHTMLFPYVVLPLKVPNKFSVAAVEEAFNSKDRLIGIFTLKKNESDDDSIADKIYPVGVVANIVHMRRMGDGRLKIIVHGLKRCSFKYQLEDTPYRAKIEVLEEEPYNENGQETAVLVNELKNSFEDLIELKNIEYNVSTFIDGITDPSRLADYIAFNLNISFDEAYKFLKMLNPIDRLKKLNGYLLKEIEVMRMQDSIKNKAFDEVNKSQKEYFLREQMAQIKKELGEDDEVGDYLGKIAEANMSEEAEEEALKQASRLSSMHSESAEANVIRTYLDWLIDIPWDKSSEDNLDIKKASKILDEDHYGLEEQKERILEFLAVKKLKNSMKGAILCFVGPPGTGKCVAEGTLITTDKGIIPIEKLAETMPGEGEFSELKVKVSTDFDKIDESSHFYNGGFKPTKKIILENGMEIEGTFNHRIKVLNYKGDLVWKRLDELALEDVVAIKDHSLLLTDKDVSLPKPTTNSSPHAVTEVKYSTPSQMDTRLARLLGILVADGSYNTSNYYSLIQDDFIHQEVVDDFIINHGDIFGYTPNKVTSETRTTYYTVCSTYLRRFLNDIGLKKRTCESKEVPWSVLQSNKQCLLTFLGGYFDGDGYVDKQGCLSASSKSKKLLSQIQIMLLHFGVVSNLKPKIVNGEVYHILSLFNNYDSNQFYRLLKLELRDPFKVKRIKCSFEENGNTSRFGDFSNLKDKLIDLWENRKGIDYSVKDRYRLNWYYHNSQFRRKTANRVFNMIQTEDVDSLEQLRNLYSLCYFKIVNIEDSFNQVYDLTVPNSKTFVANGFVNHNTSIAKSIARSMDRELVRMSLGGVRDEAELRGHRRTYIGAQPGKIIENLKRCGTSNPVFILDELDKLGSDHRGDPSSALLEVLDPEQNDEFKDHYLNVPFDLSKIFFVATANTLDTIPSALRDRLEIIHVSGYTRLEKMMIAKNHLIKKQLVENGFKEGEISMSNPAILEVIENYTRESGVRNLERKIGKIFRRIAKIKLEKSDEVFKVGKNDVAKYLKIAEFQSSKYYQDKNRIGVVNGLGWTPYGGEMLYIESVLAPTEKGGGLKITGKLGDVMQESASIAFTVAKNLVERSILFGEEGLLLENSIHVHAPEGAVPKDGPSAGITLTTSLVSLFTDTPVNKEVAMTGEITLNGKVLPIGGLKEKMLAALRNKIKTIIIPSANEKDLSEIPEEVTSKLIIKPVSNISEVLEIALVK